MVGPLYPSHSIPGISSSSRFARAYLLSARNTVILAPRGDSPKKTIPSENPNIGHLLYNTLARQLIQEIPGPQF